MKNTVFRLAVILAGVCMFTGVAFGYSIKYNDNYANWPGWFIDPRDEIGTPIISQINAMTIMVNDSDNKLQSIVFNMTGRRTPDGLFINSNWDGTYGDYQSWDYYVADPTGTTGNGQLYSVGSSYIYALATVPLSNPTQDGRWGHPVGFSSGTTSMGGEGGILKSIAWDGTSTLTYTFGDDSQGNGIVMGDKFVIGYAPWCANDVFLTPVPEPGLLVLLGAGLMGLVLLRRKTRS